MGHLALRTPLAQIAKPRIQPIGEQIIIQCIQPDSVGSIIIPDSVKAITKTGDSSLVDQLNFVEANVIACGPGKRGKGVVFIEHARVFLMQLVDNISASLDDETRDYSWMPDQAMSEAKRILKLADNETGRLSLIVKPGDRILFHPSVQRFDREIDPESIGLPANSGRCFIIREDSVLGIIEGAPQPASAGAS